MVVCSSGTLSTLELPGLSVAVVLGLLEVRRAALPSMCASSCTWTEAAGLGNKRERKARNEAACSTRMHAGKAASMRFSLDLRFSYLCWQSAWRRQSHPFPARE